MVHLGAAGRGRDVLSTGSTLPDPELRGAGAEGGGGGRLPTSALLCPQACNCDQYLKVSKDLMTQLVGLSGQDAPSSEGESPPPAVSTAGLLAASGLTFRGAGRGWQVGRQHPTGLGCEGCPAGEPDAEATGPSGWGTLLSRGPCSACPSSPAPMHTHVCTRILMHPWPSATEQAEPGQTEQDQPSYPPAGAGPTSVQPQFPFLET